MRWMMIMTIIIGFFNILPLAIRNGKLKKFVFELKVAQFFEKQETWTFVNKKQTRRGESTAQGGHSGTIHNTKLPIAKKNGPFKDVFSILMSAKEGFASTTRITKEM